MLEFVIVHRYCGYTKKIKGYNIWDALKQNKLNYKVWNAESVSKING